jgi:hypothetical protein
VSVHSPASYVPVSRGLRNHLRSLSGNAVKLYLELLLAAAFNGPEKGQVAATFGDLALRLGMHKQTIYRAAEELRPRYVVWKSAKNQHSVTVFTIQKYKNVGDFAASATTSTSVTASDQRVTSMYTAPSVIPSFDDGLSSPNKLKKLNKKQQLSSEWEAIGIEPCGPFTFRNLWKSFYGQKNGSLAAAMGECLDAWDLVRGTACKPPKFCKELSRIRQLEKSSTHTNPEIPALVASA